MRLRQKGGAGHRPSAAALQDASVMLRPMNREELGAAVESPAQVQARRVFVQSVRRGKGTEDTRRLATQAEIGEENRGLVVTGGDAAGIETVAVVHEALIQGWG